MTKDRRYYTFYYKGGQKLITSTPKSSYYTKDLDRLEVIYDPPIISNKIVISKESVNFYRD